jgi:hypothetical protein
MVFSIHQPNYIPYTGYFYKIASSDVFVILDSVQYPRGQSFAARNRIKTPQGTTYLTIPTAIPREKEGKVSYLEVDYADTKWKEKHLKTLAANYKRTPFYKEIIEIYSGVLTGNAGFAETNINLIHAFLKYLQINTKIVRLSELLVEYGKKTNLIIDIGKALNANTYLSGTGGGKEYNDESLLNQNGISLSYSKFKHPVYAQLWGEFIPNLSVIDFLFNCGSESRNILLKSNG